MIYVNRLTNLPEEIISTCTENSIKFHTNNICYSIQVRKFLVSKYENFLPEVS